MNRVGTALSLFVLTCAAISCARQGSRIADLPMDDVGDSATTGDMVDLEAPDQGMTDDSAEKEEDLPQGDLQDLGEVDSATPCTGPVNVVENEFSSDLKIDLANWSKGNYKIEQTIRVTPEMAGTSVSLYGIGFVLGKASVPHTYDGEILTVCPGSFHAGETIEFTVDFLVKKNGLYLGMFGLTMWEDNQDRFMVGPNVEPHHAARWWFVPQAIFEVDPENDDSKVVTGLTMEITAPDETWVVTGPGGLGRKTGTTWKFSLSTPIPLYAVSFAASPFYELFEFGDGYTSVEFWGAAFVEDKEWAEEAYVWAEATVAFMEQHFGPYIFEGETGKTLVLAEVPKYGGAMENVGVIWMGTDAMDPLIVAHETVHHWLGNALRFADWPDFWLAEGFTEFVTMYHFAATVLDEMQIAAIKDNYRDNAVAIGWAFPGALSFDPVENMDDHFMTNMSYYYVYGATVLEMIDQRLLRAGGEGFWPLLTKKWYCDTCDEVETADFEAFMVAEAGDAGVDWQLFFEDWIYNPLPPPMLEFSNYQYDGATVSFEMARTDGNQAAMEGLELGLVVGGDMVWTTVDVAYGPDTDVVQVAVETEPSLIVVDPDIMFAARLETAEEWSGPQVSNSLFTE